MKELKAYVAQKNKWNAIFGGAPLELAAGQVRARYRTLTQCAEQLLKLDPSVQIYEFG